MLSQEEVARLLGGDLAPGASQYKARSASPTARGLRVSEVANLKVSGGRMSVVETIRARRTAPKLQGRRRRDRPRHDRRPDPRPRSRSRFVISTKTMRATLLASATAVRLNLYLTVLRSNIPFCLP